MSYLDGCDVSYHQGTINWQELDSGTNFVIIKTSGGDKGLYRDSQFTANQTGARKISLTTAVGYYHFAGGGDPVAEADYFLSQVGQLQTGEFLCLDFEVQAHANPGDWCGRFYNRVHDKTGVWCIVYAPRSLMAAIYESVPEAGLWLADPDDSPNSDAQYNGKTVPYPYIMQQYKTGTFPGITEPTDVDALFITLAELRERGYQTTPAVTTASLGQSTSYTTEVIPTPIVGNRYSIETPATVDSTPTVATTAPSLASTKATYGVGLLALITSVEKYFTGDHTLSQYLTTVQGGIGYIGAAVIAIKYEFEMLKKEL